MKAFKPVFVALALCVGAPCFAQAADAPASSVAGTAEERLAIASQIIDIAYPAEQREEMFFKASISMSDQMLASLDGTIADQGAQAILDQTIEEMHAEQLEILRDHIPAIMAGFSKAYANMFTYDELVDILDFVKTPTGSQFLLKSTEIISDPDFAAANQAYMSESMAVVKRTMPIMVRKLVEYSKSK